MKKSVANPNQIFDSPIVKDESEDDENNTGLRPIRHVLSPPRQVYKTPIQQAIYDWLFEEFGTTIIFNRDNNPIECYSVDTIKFMCQIRVDVIAMTVAIWRPVGNIVAGVDSPYNPKYISFQCHPYKSWHLSDPKSLDSLRDSLNELRLQYVI